MAVLGLDVSRWQGRMDWVKAARAGAWFVFVKASQGTAADQSFEKNWAGSRGLLLRGAYHFYHPGISPKAQARAFYEIVKAAGDLGKLPPVLDVEREPRSGWLPTWQEVLDFLAETEHLFGRVPVVYTSAGMVSAITSEYGQAPPEALARYPLWVAHYGTEKPAVPPPWKEWTFWQYTSQAPGPDWGAESGYIDVNRWRGTLPELLEWAFQGQEWPAAAWLWQATRRLLGEMETNPLPPQGERYRVKVRSLRVRRGPGLAHPVVAHLRRGTDVVVTEKRRGDGYTWGRIVEPQHLRGRWLALEFCEKVKGNGD